MSAVATVPTFEEIDTQYRQVIGLLGAAYVEFDAARTKLSNLKKQRDALVSQYQLFQKMSAAQTPTQETVKPVDDK